MRARHLLLTTSVIVSAALALPAGASAGFPWPGTVSQTPDTALAALNDYRAATSEAPVLDMLPGWNQGCASHVGYMVANNVLTHPEDPAKPGYSAAGDWAGKHAVLSSGRGNPTLWDSAVYHRLSILAPRLRHAGWAVGASGYSCMVTQGADANGSALDDSPAAQTPGLTLHPWPANNATGVPLSFPNNESPAPSNDAGTTKLGYLLSVNANGPWGANTDVTSDVTSASLTPDGGAALTVAVSDVDSPNHFYLSGGFGLFPVGALPTGTWLTAHAVGAVSAKDYNQPGAPTTAYPFDLTWRFQTTGAAAPVPLPKPAPTPAPAPVPGTPATGPAGPLPLTPNPSTSTHAVSLAGTRSRQRLATVLRRGLTARLTLSTSSASSATVSVSARTAGRLGVPATLGRARFTGGPAGVRRVRIPLTARSRARLRALRAPLTISVTVVTRALDGTVTRGAVTVQLIPR